MPNYSMRFRNHPFIISICTAIVAVHLALAFFFPKLYILATYEDLIGEWLQFWLFITATALFVRLASLTSNYRWFFAIVALGCFYVSMEEISWGQRLMNLQTPEFFQKHNIQKEINFHNLVTGPVATMTKRIITVGLSAGIVLYGVLYPLALRWGWKMSRPFLRMGIAPPPIFLWPFFTCGAFLELGLFRFNETEVAELLISAALVVMGLYYNRLSRYDTRLVSLTACHNVELIRIAAPVCAVFLLASIMALGTTAISFSSHTNRAIIGNRLNNGVEKFAGRYKRYKQWETAAGLYLHIHQWEPKRNSILRKLAECYRQMGYEDQFRFYNDRALANDLTRYQKDPDSIALNQSLARTYRQRNQPEKAQYHLERSLQLALDWVEKKPNSAKAAYWLGKTYRLLDQAKPAETQFARAHNLDPTSLKYRKAYYRALN